MMLRRVGGRVRWLPGDLLATPLMAVGTWLLAGIDVVTNRVADGPWTVRVLLANPLDWLTVPRGWAGLALLAAGVVLAVLGRRLGKPGRWGCAVRFVPYRIAALALLAAAALSLWSLSQHVTDLGSGGAQWRFTAEARTRWINDLTTVLLGAGALACFVLSFGRVRPVDAEAQQRHDRPVPADAGAQVPAQATRERVPTTTAASASTSSTMPRGVATKRRSTGAAKRPDTGS